MQADNASKSKMLLNWQSDFKEKGQALNCSLSPPPADRKENHNDTANVALLFK